MTRIHMSLALAAALTASTALAARGILAPIPNASVGREIIVPIRPASAAISPFRNHATDWPKYCANLEMTGVPANETRITLATAPSLTQVWMATLGGKSASQPTIVGNIVYMGDWSGNETAFDAATGAVLAQTNLGTTHQGQCNPPSLGITSSAAVGSGTLYIAGGDDYFYALDARTLSTVWKTSLGDTNHGYYGWCSPALLPEQVIQGVSSNCDNPFVNGYVDSLDPAVGGVVLSADLSRTDNPSDYGAGVWTSPAIDLAAREIYVSTASAYHYTDGDAYSVLRIGLDDLVIEDRWKISLADYNAVADPDWGSSPTLFTDNASRQLFGAGQKDGHYYAFLRTNLAAGPVWAASVAVGGSCPQCSGGTLSTASFDGNTLYVGGGAPPKPTAANQNGTVVALDPTTGNILWRYSTFNGPVIAPISSANGVVFAAGGTHVVALDASTGTPLWSFTTPQFVYGGIAISDGRIFFGDQGSSFFCFGVPR